MVCFIWCFSRFRWFFYLWEGNSLFYNLPPRIAVLEMFFLIGFAGMLVAESEMMGAKIARS